MSQQHTPKSSKKTAFVAVARLKPLQAVRAQYHLDPEKPAKAITLLRQFVPPSLLNTNSGVDNAKPLDTTTDDVQVVGVIVSVHRALST